MAPSRKIAISERPVYSMPAKASGTPKTSSKARVMALAPAPPELSSVLSMSKR
jgi:hypothetical protein